MIYKLFCIFSQWNWQGYWEIFQPIRNCSKKDKKASYSVKQPKSQMMGLLAKTQTSERRVKTLEGEEDLKSARLRDFGILQKAYCTQLGREGPLDGSLSLINLLLLANCRQQCSNLSYSCLKIAICLKCSAFCIVNTRAAFCAESIPFNTSLNSCKLSSSSIFCIFLMTPNSNINPTSLNRLSLALILPSMASSCLSFPVSKPLSTAISTTASRYITTRSNTNCPSRSNTSMINLDSTIPSINSTAFSTTPSALRSSPRNNSIATSLYCRTSPTYSCQLYPSSPSTSLPATPEALSRSLGKLGSARRDCMRLRRGDWHLLMFKQYTEGSQHNITNRMQGLDTIEVEIECPLSRSTIQRKCFSFSKGRNLSDLREILMTVFELEGLLAQFRFYHQRQQIQALREIQESPQRRYHILLQLQFQGG